MFAYSEREGTYAARKMPDTVPAEVKQRRLAEVIALQQRITGEIMAAQVGRRERVLVEQRCRSASADRADGAHRRASAPVIVPAAPGSRRARWSTRRSSRATHKTLFGALATVACRAPTADLAQNPFALLSLIAAPAVLTNAASVLAISTSNRFLRASERMRALSVRVEDQKLTPGLRALVLRAGPIAPSGRRCCC